MWLMWMFSVVIPLGVIHAIVSGEISLGGGSVARSASRILRFEENPVGFVVMLGALCILEFMLVTALLRIRQEGLSSSTKRRRGSR